MYTGSTMSPEAGGTVGEGCRVSAGQATRILKSLRGVVGGSGWAGMLGQPHSLRKWPEPPCTLRKMVEEGGRGEKGCDILNKKRER